MARILLVEDNEMNRDMLSRRLTRRGYVVITANDGAEAVRLAHAELPDLVLMDLSLPIVDGLEAVRLIRSGPDTSELRIIALTAHALATDRQKALDAGCHDYDTKPVDLERLIGKIEAQLKPND